MNTEEQEQALEEAKKLAERAVLAAASHPCGDELLCYMSNCILGIQMETDAKRERAQEQMDAEAEAWAGEESDNQAGE